VCVLVNQPWLKLPVQKEYELCVNRIQTDNFAFGVQKILYYYYYISLTKEMFHGDWPYPEYSRLHISWDIVIWNESEYNTCNIIYNLTVAYHQTLFKITET